MNMNLKIDFAQKRDLKWLTQNDTHVSRKLMMKKISDREIIVAAVDNKPVGWLRYNFFWDEIPFMNMLVIKDEHQKKGIGKKLDQFWEDEMKKIGHRYLMTSTQSNEEAQHFYRKIGYKKTGSFKDQDNFTELILAKNL